MPCAGLVRLHHPKAGFHAKVLVEPDVVARPRILASLFKGVGESHHAVPRVVNIPDCRLEQADAFSRD